MIKIGDKVMYRYYNTPDHKFYGYMQIGEVEDITLLSGKKLFYVRDDKDTKYLHVLQRKEIKRIVK